MQGAAVSMYVPKENSMYVQVSGAQTDSEYSLIAVDLETGKETAAYGLFFSDENVKLLSLVHDETDGKTYGFVSRVGKLSPTKIQPFFGYLEFSPGKAIFKQIGDNSYVPSGTLVNSVYLPDQRVIVLSTYEY